MQGIIAGGTGFIGQALVKHLLEKDYRLTVLGRQTSHITQCFGDKVEALSWDDFNNNSQAYIADKAFIINLCGANIGAGRWTAARKKVIIESRVETTQHLVKALTSLTTPPPRLLNASAIGIYGLQQSNTDNLTDSVDEQSRIPENPTDFLSDVGQLWENACLNAVEHNVHVTLLRFGVVLGKGGGALPKMALPFHMGLGGKVGSGQQVLSWISLDDVCSAIEFLIENPKLKGPINLVAPQAIQQAEFAKTLASILQRPALLTTPAFMLKLIFGQMAQELLLQGQHVVPTRLLEAGYQFQDCHVESALKKIYA